ncbi:MAG: type II secretion system protein N [Sulfitobacter sp.]|nr:type II secretion system protein N [Sulfitobacter sp.]
MSAPRLWLIVALSAVIVAASLLFAGTHLFWHLQGHTTVLPQTLAAPPAPSQEPAPRDTGAIIALAPFGSIAAAPEDDRPSQPVRTLNVALRGVLVDPDPAASRAFLLVDGQTAIFRLGDPVSAAELVAINTDTVTLKTDEELLIVGFDGIENDEARPENTEIAQTAAENPNDPFARLVASIVPGQGSIDLRDPPPPETTEDYINFWRDRITKNPQTAMDTVGVELVENGYRIKENPNIGVTLAGLRTGDVITRLNGQTLGDLESDRILYDEVAAAGIARVEVVRDGKALLLTFPLR